MPGDGSVEADAGGADGATEGSSGDGGNDGAPEVDAAVASDADASVDAGSASDADSSFDGRIADGTSSDADGGGPDVSLDGRVDDGSVEASADGDGASIDAEASVDAGREAEAEAEAWTPTRLANLSLWLDAEVGVTSIADLVSVWRDRSGHGNDASQPLASERPMLVTGALNGHAVVRFDGNSNFLSIPDAPSLRWGTGDYTVEVVLSFTNDPNVGWGYGMVFAKFETINPWIGPTMWANYPNIPSVIAASNRADEVVISDMTNLNDGASRVVGMRRTGLTHFEVRVNGTPTARTVSITNVDALSNFVYIGGQPQPDVIQALKGDIAEIVAVGGTLPPADLATLEAYFKTKYGL
jgi:hypothetical protein